MATQLPTRVTTGKVRLSYVHLFKKFAVEEGQTPRFSCVIVIPKSDTKTIEKIRTAQQNALENGKMGKFGGKIPKNWTDTLHDGDEDADLERNPEYKGCYYMTVGNSIKPGTVDRNYDELTEDDGADGLYSGCYARVSLDGFPFNASGNKGVSFGLRNVQKLGDGEALGATIAKAEDDFEPLDDEDDDLI